MKDNKFNIGDKVAALNIGQGFPLVTDFYVRSMHKRHDGIFYKDNNTNWLPEMALFPSRKEAYQFIMDQCANEMTNTAYVQRFAVA